MLVGFGLEGLVIPVCRVIRVRVCVIFGYGGVVLRVEGAETGSSFTSLSLSFPFSFVLWWRGKIGVVDGAFVSAYPGHQNRICFQN